MSIDAPAANTSKPLGFWACWSLTVGVMIGSGVFTLPALLAPYGLMSFGGWLISGVGAIFIALLVGRLASRTTRSGGPYIYAHEAFGDLTGFLMAWGYWGSYWIALPTIAIAFAGYLPVFIPALADNPWGQAASALALIWGLTLVNVVGLREGGFVQLVTTLLKLVPLLAIIGAGFVAGDVENLPVLNPSAEAPLGVLAATALLTMWAFSGLEAGGVAAEGVRDPERTIPRAIVIGTLTVTLVYLAATAAVMALVPAGTLAQSTSPFADAARALGPWGPGLIAAGALVATAGALNGVVFVCGQMPMAVALDRLAPAPLAKRNTGGSPYVALILSSLLGSLLLFANYSRGLADAFAFMLKMSTVTALIPLLLSAAAELKYSASRSWAWSVVAILGGVFCLFAILGSGFEVLAWGFVLLAIGVPIFYAVRRTSGWSRT